MLSAVNLENDFGVCTEEIDDEAIDWHLPLEFPTGESATAQAKPEYSLGVGLILTQPPRRLDVSAIHPAPLTPTLSPRGERERTVSGARSPLIIAGAPSSRGRRPSK